MHLHGISGLKAVAAISVVFYHLNQIRPNGGLSKDDWDWYQFVETWTIAVSFFFMVSGLFLGLQYIKARNDSSEKISISKDIFGRIIRLIPAFLFILFVSIGVDISLHGINSIQTLQVLGGILLLGPFFNEAFFPSLSNGALWYIAFDIWCFVISSCILLLALKFSESVENYTKKLISLNKGCILIKGVAFWFVVAIFVGILFLVHYLTNIYIEKPSEGILALWSGKYTVWIFTIHYLVGVVVAEGIMLLYKYKKILSFVSDFIFILIGYGLYIFLWDIRELGDFDKTIASSPFHFPYATIYIGGLLLSAPFLFLLKPLFENVVTQFISRISYSVYLVHGIWIALFLFYFPLGQTNLNQWYSIAIGTWLLTFLSAWGLNRTVEKWNWWKDLIQRKAIEQSHPD